MSRNVDLVVVGSGLAGLAAVVTASELGLRPVLLEKSQRLGGATAFSAGQAWVGANHVARRDGAPQDSIEDTLTYVRALASARPEFRDDEVTRQWVEAAPAAARFFEDVGAVRWRVVADYPDYYMDRPGAKLRGRYLTVEPFEGARLDKLRPLLLDSPNFPIGFTYDEIFSWGGLSSRLAWDWDVLAQRRRDDILTFGQGLAAHFLHAAAERDVPILPGHRVVRLCGDARGIEGLVAEGPEGEVTFDGPVVLATGAFDWNLELVAEHTGLPSDELASAAPRMLTGDGMALVRAVGGAVLDLPPEFAPRLPGYRVEPTYPEDNGWRQCMEHALPHTFIVNRKGMRFCDDSFHRALVPAVLAERGPDGRLPNVPMFMVWDAQHHRKYGLGATMPGEPYPDGLVETTSTIEDLASKLGIDPQGLAETTRRFNDAARRGEDPDFGRGGNCSVQMYRGDTAHEPNANLGPVEEPPFHGMHIRLMSLAISSSGLHARLDGQVQSEHGEPIPGLYAAGNCVALDFMGSGYNSGYPLSRAMTYGFLAAHHAAGKHWRATGGPEH